MITRWITCDGPGCEERVLVDTDRLGRFFGHIDGWERPDFVQHRATSEHDCPDCTHVEDDPVHWTPDFHSNACRLAWLDDHPGVQLEGERSTDHRHYGRPAPGRGWSA